MPILLTFSFSCPQWLYGLPLILLLGLLSGREGFIDTITYSSVSSLKPLGKVVKKKAGGYHISFLMLGLICCLLGLARPIYTTTYHAQSEDGIDLVIALDLSYSMIIEDFHPNDDISKPPIMRLDAAKKVLQDFIDKRSHDRIGIIAFSGRPYSLSPITHDHSWLQKRLKSIKIGDIKEQGTAVGSSIAASATKLTEREALSKVIVLITDGANNTGNIDPEEASRLCAELDIKIYTIAIGTENGRVPSSIQRFPKQEFDLPTLKAIAVNTGGEFFRAKSVLDLNTTFQSINTLEKTTETIRSTTLTTELFQWFVAASSLCFLCSLSFSCIYPNPTL